VTRRYELTIAGVVVSVSVEGPNDGKLRVSIGQDTYTASAERTARGGAFGVTIGSQKFEVLVSPQPTPDEYLVTIAGRQFTATLKEATIAVQEPNRTLPPQSASASAPTGKSVSSVMEKQLSKELGAVLAPLPGRVIEVRVSVGQSVQLGDVILVLEAMKMANEIRSTQKGVVKKLHVQSGEAVEKGQPLITIE
jgi:biotin carboxyl carrier protein